MERGEIFYKIQGLTKRKGFHKKEGMPDFFYCLEYKADITLTIS